MSTFVKLIPGSFHQGNEKFGPSSGKKCTCFSLFSIAFSVVKNPGYWKSVDIDYIVENGDQIYKQLNLSNDYVMFTDLPRDITIMNNLFSIEFLYLLAGNRWGADFTTLRTSAIALCYSVAEYCSPIWSHSTHCKKVDVSLNNCMRLISGCIKSTPTEILPVLCGIEPADIRRDKNTLDLRNRALLNGHMLNTVATNPLLNIRLKSRSPLSSRMHSLAAGYDENISSRTWAEAKWKQRWNELSQQLKQFIPSPSNKPPGCDLKRCEWVLLNRIRSGYGRYASFMHRIGLSDNANCLCGETQTPQHVLVCQTIGIRGDIKTVDDDFRTWLANNVLDI